MTTAAKGCEDARTGTRSCCVLGGHLGRQRQLRRQHRGQISNPFSVSPSQRYLKRLKTLVSPSGHLRDGAA